MPELKNLFIKGKMNKDLDERLVPQGEYRDALNVSVSYSEGSDVGALQNILGNQLRTRYNSGGETPILNFPPNATCIGTVRDTEKDKIYWFGTSDGEAGEADFIAELDPSDNSVDIILCDAYTSPSTRILNFSTSNLITGVAVLDGVLYFTDDLNEPRQVDIKHWRSVTSDDFTTTSANLSDDRISLYKKAPLNAPTFESLSSSIRKGNGTTGETKTFSENLNLFTLKVGDTLSNKIISTDGTGSGAGPNYILNDKIFLNYTYIDISGKTIENKSEFKITAVNSSTSFDIILLSKSPNIKNESISYETILKEEDPLFELKFPKFSYRYKYTNGQYSSFSPFSVAAFIPNNFKYNAVDGYNLGMVNTVRELKLKGWGDEFTNTPSGDPLTIEPAENSYEADIEEIDILYKDSVSNNIYIVDSIKKQNGNFAAIFEVKDEQIYKVIQSNQLLRPFDSIPKKAKALEITGNRLIFGNYLQNFNYTSIPTFQISVGARTSANEIKQKLSLKSLRTYQAGISFQDKYGRQTPIFTDKSGVYKLPIDNSDDNLQFKISVSTTPPADATHFKYFIKETSGEYYNLPLSNYYSNDEDYIYLSFPSSEVNKVSENDYLILKKNFNNTPYKETNNKFKIIGKSETPPDFLTTISETTYTATDIEFADTFSGDDTAITQRTPGRTPMPGHATFVLRKAQPIGGTGNDVSDDVINELSIGKKFQFRSGNKYSKTYEILKFNIGDPSTTEDDVEIITTKPFGNDVNSLYDNTTPGGVYSGVEILFITESSPENINIEFKNKFFIKLNKDPFLLKALENEINFSDLKIVDTQYLGGYKPDGTEAQRLFYAPFTFGDLVPDGFFGIGEGIAETNIQGADTIEFKTIMSYNRVESAYSDRGFDPFLQVGNYLRFGNVPNTLITPAQPDSSENYNDGDLAEVYKITNVESTIINENFTGYDNNAYGLRKKYTITIDKPLLVDIQGDVSQTTFADRNGKFKVDILTDNLDKDSFYDPIIFETEPEKGLLDIYYETEKTFPISQLNTLQSIPWANCISFGNGVESDRIRDDFNAPTIGKGVRVSTVFEDNYKEERVKSGLIFSQIYNGKNGINRLNQFIIAENITEEANPIYGSIQKLNTRDTDLTLLCDDAILKVPARKDLLFQADGNPQVTSTDRFLGTIIPYAGNYGCQHPESFADHIYRAYFVDRTRGKVLRLSGDGITEISNYGMKDYFKDKLVAETGYMFGSYDENKDHYNISLPVENTVVAFSESVNGWPTRKSFYEMESGISLNNMYYTFKDGKIFSHDNETRNTFYGAKTDSEVTFYLNGNPGNIKNFRTLNYQGDSEWVIKKDLQSDPKFFGLKTDKQNGAVDTFVEKEGIYYNYISGNLQVTKEDLDLKALNVQGLGTPISISGNDATFADLNNAIQVGDQVFNNSDDSVKAVQSISGNTITLVSPPTNAFSYFVKDNRFNTSGIVGYYAEITMTNTSTDKKELYSVGSEVSLSS